MAVYAFMTGWQALAIGGPVAVALLAIVIALFKCSCAHRERMAMIRRRLHPDTARLGSPNDGSVT